jgi:hypothetical protein
MTTDPIPAPRIATDGTIRLSGAAAGPYPAGEAALLSGAPPATSPQRGAPPPPLGPSPCHEPSDQGWCNYCEPRATMARMRAAFPCPTQGAGRVVG